VLSKTTLAKILTTHKRSVDDGVRLAAGRWQRAYTSSRTRKAVTGRDDSASTRDLKGRLSLLGKALRPAGLKSFEHDHLMSAAKPLRLALETIFAVPAKPRHRPDSRGGGYAILATRIAALERAGVARRTAASFAIERLLIIFPPERNPTWLYDVQPHQKGNVHQVLVDRLCAYLKKAE
jgi:hypothetical protein